jgi:hypothetical protein
VQGFGGAIHTTKLLGADTMISLAPLDDLQLHTSREKLRVADFTGACISRRRLPEAHVIEVRSMASFM